MNPGTGFVVPTCSTVYLNKPIKTLTLMQTVARDDRRASGKSAGVMVDYVGVIQNLQMARAIDTCRALDYAAPGAACPTKT